MLPFIQLFGKQFSTYGLMMALAVVIVGALSILRGKRRGLVAEDVLITGATAVSIGLLGAKIVYILVTFSPAQLLQMLQNGDTSFLSGGMVFFGGLLFGLVGMWLGLRIAKCSFGALERSVVPLLPLGHAIGRIGCLLAGCCHGMSYEGLLAVHYQPIVPGIDPAQGYFPVQLLEAVINVGICAVLLWYERKVKKPFQLLAVYLGIYSVCRFCLEFLRGDEIRGLWLGVSVSQWISLALFTGTVIYFVCSIGKTRKKESAAS